MREIKFRGKSIKLNIFVYGYYMYSELENKHYILGESKDYGFLKEEVDPNTVGQLIGKKDKNGRDIYESDVLEETTKKGNKEYKSLILVSIYHTYLGTDVRYIKNNNPSRKTFYWWGNTFEVIGNIYDNPELVKND